MRILELARNTTRMNSDSTWLIFYYKKITAKPTDFKCSNYKKYDVLTWRNTLLKQVKSCIGNNLNATDVNVINTTKNNLLNY